MAYVTVEDVAATWEQYERSLAALVDPVPAGLILHAAGKTDEGYRVVDVWESEAAWQQFRARRPARRRRSWPGRRGAGAVPRLPTRPLLVTAITTSGEHE